MEAVQHEPLRDPVLHDHVIKRGVNGVGGGCQEERDKHNARLAEPSPPGAEQQNGNQPAEEDFSADGKHFVDRLQSHQRDQGQNQDGNLEAARILAALGAGEAQRELDGDGHEDAAGPKIQNVENLGGDPGQPMAELQGAGDGDGQAHQGQPEIFGMVALGQVENPPQGGDAEEQEDQDQLRDDLLIPLAGNRQGHAVGDILARAGLDPLQETVGNGNPGSGPGSNRQTPSAHPVLPPGGLRR